jgi:putative transposase
MKSKHYPADSTDAQWVLLARWIPRPGNRPRKADMREVVNAILYLTREGCRSGALPHYFPPWKTAYNYFQTWTRDGTWDRILTALRLRLRQAAGRDPQPRVACIDSESVKTAGGGEEVDSDGGKMVRGRKRHIVMDTMRFLLAGVVTAANVDEAQAAQDLFAQIPGIRFPRLEVVQADQKYHNGQLDRWLRVHHRHYVLWVISRPAGERRFNPLRSRRVVERTLAWLGRSRRLSKDYEHWPESSEDVTTYAGIHHYLRRLCPEPVACSQRFRFMVRRPKTAA